MNDTAFHPLKTSISKPEKFTFPFCYSPHPLCLLAAHEVQEHILSRKEWQEEVNAGKMFGVLIVEDASGALGYLAAYSGLLDGRNDWQYFVPAVFDAQQPDGYFKKREKEISEINSRIDAIEHSAKVIAGRQRLKETQMQTEAGIAAYIEKMKAAKTERDKRRQGKCWNPAEEPELIRESQFMKAELKRMRKRQEASIEMIAGEMRPAESLITALRNERKRKSDDLQHWLFSQFNMLNALGESRNLIDIFKDTVSKYPPAGAGECCAPKLLQYAFLNGMHPVCMAEFWWGASPRTEIRRHKHYYPACQGKCKPILAHMLRGLDVESNPLETDMKLTLETIYDDEWLTVVNKPAGMLSVPGKSDRESVLSIIRERCPEASGPMIVHRLDMATSGLIVVAKNKEVHQQLQLQFKNHEVRKRYIAIVDGIIRQKRGTIELPLTADRMDRPRQKVDRENGKAAITEYEVTAVCGTQTRLALYPHTGRTHQLRVHCAHPDGLHAPIVGDGLYGKLSDRLFLHAESISFVHPVTGRLMTFEVKAGF